MEETLNLTLLAFPFDFKLKVNKVKSKRSIKYFWSKEFVF